MEEKVEKKTTFERAVDLNGKLKVLITACSDVTNHISSKMDEIQKISSFSSEISSSIETMERQKESLDKALKATKRDYENEKKSFDDWKVSKANDIEKLRSEAVKDRDEAKGVLESLKSKESKLNADLEAADSLNRQLNEKLNAIAKIGGVK